MFKGVEKVKYDLIELFNIVLNANNYEEKIEHCNYFISIYRNAYNNNEMPETIYNQLQAQLVKELDYTKNCLEKSTTWEERNPIFNYFYDLFYFFALYYIKNNTDKDDKLHNFGKECLACLNKYIVLEKTIECAFLQKTANIDEIKNIIDIVKAEEEDLYRSKLYYGLIKYRNKLSRLDFMSKNYLQSFIESELERYVEHISNLKKFEEICVELICDLLKDIYRDSFKKMLKKILLTNKNNLKVYAIIALAHNNVVVDEKDIIEVAKDLSEYDILYTELKGTEAFKLIPNVYLTQEYICKSQLVRWLIYPTELGQEPDEIEYLGSIKKKKEIYYIYKYRSQTGKLPDDLKGKWLIGWSTNDGDTFSQFELLEKFEQKNPKKTLKVIAKSL